MNPLPNYQPAGRKLRLTVCYDVNRQYIQSESEKMLWLLGRFLNVVKPSETYIRLWDCSITCEDGKLEVLELDTNGSRNIRPKSGDKYA